MNKIDSLIKQKKEIERKLAIETIKRDAMRAIDKDKQQEAIKYLVGCINA